LSTIARATPLRSRTRAGRAAATSQSSGSSRVDDDGQSGNDGKELPKSKKGNKRNTQIDTNATTSTPLTTIVESSGISASSTIRSDKVNDGDRLSLACPSVLLINGTHLVLITVLMLRGRGKKMSHLLFVLAPIGSLHVASMLLN
jgi:hypothetical protein